MSQPVDHGILGQTTSYPTSYCPEILFPILREPARITLNLAPLPFHGEDCWTSFELSWLNSQGKPEVAMAEFIFPCTTKYLIESKSFKLYLNSFNQTVFNSFATVQQILIRDLTKASEGAVCVNIYPLSNTHFNIQTLEGINLDLLSIPVDTYHVKPEFLTIQSTDTIQEALYSHLFRSNCPVTGQPDWASVWIHYEGPKINHESLLRYLISFREHQGFHEECVERMYRDIMQKCKPKNLTVYARFTRRGGLDINPYRSNFETLNFTHRLVRQ